MKDALFGIRQARTWTLALQDNEALQEQLNATRTQLMLKDGQIEQLEVRDVYRSMLASTCA